jgi:GMP synthase (glutamine-hydrolysing)
MDKLNILQNDAQYVEALRGLIRTGVRAAPNLESSPLVDMPVVLQRSGHGASPTKRAHVFTTILQEVVRRRLTGKEAQTALILFGLEAYAGVPIQDRYRAVAKLYNTYWTWENYRKEPLTRHLLAVYLALKREVELTAEDPLTRDSRAADWDKPNVQSSSKVLIVQNISREGPGLLKRLLDEVAVSYEVVDLGRGDRFPDPTHYAALVLLGGPDSANDTTAKMRAELRQVKRAFDAGVPYLGICLGLQVASKVMGGEVIQSPIKEVGLSTPDGVPYSISLTSLALTALGKKDPLFVGLKNHFRVFQLHGETVVLTKAMQLLAVGQECPNQIVKFRRNAYGIQSHFELTREMLGEWLKADPDLSPLGEQRVMGEFDAIEEVYTIAGLSLLRNFLSIAGVIS